MKILVLDGVNKNTLAIVRHIGKLQKAKMHVVSYQKASIAFFSKYVSKRIIIKAPTNSIHFYNELLQLLADGNYDLLIPVGFQSFKICCVHSEEIKKYARLFLPPLESFEIAADKTETTHVAESLGIPVPKTIVVKNIEELSKIEISYPAVIKAPKELGKSIVDYAKTKEELIEKFKNVCNRIGDEKVMPIIQEYIMGDGYGFFAYYEEGQCLRIFMHKRIREFPASGGASVCAEAFYDEKLQTYGIKLLDALQWNGVAMVEFKKDSKTEEYKLLEINPKFWGSLDLSLVSGVNFPYFLVQRAMGIEVAKDYTFKTNTRFQWLLNGELYHFIDRPKSIMRILKNMFGSKNDIWLRDPLPIIFQLLMVPVDIYKYWFK